MEEAPPVKGGRPGEKKDPAGRFPCVRGRNREQITVEQKFISGCQRSRGRPEAGTGAKRQAGRRNREQITVEQKFISGFRRAGSWCHSLNPAQTALGNAAGTISGKVGSIHKHIDKVLDADWKTILH